MESPAAIGIARTRMPWGQLWLSLRGRASRFDYWVRFALVAAGIALLAKFIDLELGYREGALGNGEVFSPLVDILLVWPTVAVCVKRCHDFDRSGWWFLIWILVMPWAGLLFIGLLFKLIGASQGFMMLVIVLYSTVAFFIWPMTLGFRPGTIGPNRYGPDPNAASQSSVASPSEMGDTVKRETPRERLKRWWIAFKAAPATARMDRASLKATLAKVLQSDAYKDDREGLATIGLNIEMLQDPNFDLDVFFHNLLVKDALQRAVGTQEGLDFIEQAAELKPGTPEMKRHYDELIRRFASDQSKRIVTTTRRLAR